MRYVFVYTVVIYLFLGVTAFAQVQNYAVQFDGRNHAASINTTSLNITNNYTIQLYVSPDSWKNAGDLFQIEGQGSKVSLTLSPNEGDLSFEVNDESVTLSGVALNKWSQITLIYQAKVLIFMLDGVVINRFDGEFSLSEDINKLVLGRGFLGRIDEFRIWSVALDCDNIDELMIKNTLNKFHPQWHNLELYYKFDQNLSEKNIVDYSGTCHAKMQNNVTRCTVNDNDNFKYRVVSGYSSFTRHSDRPFIDLDMHLMTNDLIMLDVIVNGYTGETYIGSEDGEALGEYEHVEKYKGREGVIRFDGIGSFNIGDTKVMYGLPYDNNYTISTWVNVDSWSDDAYLYKREASNTNRFNIKLPKNKRDEIVVEIGENRYTFRNVVAKGVWHHVGVVASIDNGVKVSLFVDNKPCELTSQKIVDDSYTIYDVVNVGTDALVGEGLCGAVDNIVTRRSFVSDFASEMQLVSDEFKFSIGGRSSVTIDGIWKFDNLLNVGYNDFGWHTKLNNVRSIYDGYRGSKVRLGFISHEPKPDGYKVWTDSIQTPKWRSTLISEVEKIIPYCDGVDLDFEWLDNNPDNPSWAFYGELIKNMRRVVPADKLLTVSLHPVSYTMPLTDDVMNAVDFITFQNYGPFVTQIYYDAYAKFFETAVEYGFPVDKIRLSMTTLAVLTDNSGHDVIGYKDLDFSKLTPQSQTTFRNGKEYLFNNINDVKLKAKLLVDGGSGGCMYFDMGNDRQVSSQWSLIKALNSIISSNIDKLIIDIDDDLQSK